MVRLSFWLDSIAECRPPRFEVERGDNRMVARQPDLLLGGSGHDGDDEGGDLLKDPFMHVDVVSFDAEGAVVGVGKHPPGHNVEGDGKAVATGPQGVDDVAGDDEGIDVPDEGHRVGLAGAVVP